MIALVIAAGEGSRLKKEGLAVNKPMVLLNNQPLIHRLTDIICRNGFDAIHVIINEESGDVRDFLGAITSQYTANIDFIEKSTQGSLYSLYELIKEFNPSEFFLFTIDSVFKEDEFKRFKDYCITHKNYDAIMGVTSFIDDEKPLYAELHGDRITSFDNENISDYVTGGIYYFNMDIKEMLELTLESSMQSLRYFLKHLCDKGMNVGYFIFEKVIDIDHVRDIETASLFLKDDKMNIKASH